MTPNPPLKPGDIWRYKPRWCQPWSIVLTGTSLIAASWLIFHSIWVTALVGLPVLSWMGFFIVVYPRLLLQSGYFSPEMTEVSAYSQPSSEAEP